MATTRQFPERTELTQPIWNPEAAANWSLPFTPVFGSFIHMKNWKTLGEPEKAHASMVWFIISIVVVCAYFGVAVLAQGSELGDIGVRIAAFVYLGVWYLTFARKQMAYVKAHHGEKYPKKKWWMPLGIAVVCVLGLYASAFVVGLAIGLAGVE